MTTGLFSLPNDIFCFLANRLLPTDEQNKLIFKFSHDWRNLMNTSKTHFADFKKHTVLIVLKAAHTLNFTTSSSFRDRIMQLIINPLEQLELHFVKWFGQSGLVTINFSSCPAVKKVTLQSCQFLQLPPAFRELCLILSNSNDLQIRNPIKSLKVYESPKQDASKITLLDVRLLNILEEASFSFVRLENYQHFSHLRSLHVEGIDIPM
jgi:hypothetical protein